MMELTEMRIFSDTEYESGQCRGFLLIGTEEETAELFHCTPWTSEKEAERLLNARYVELVVGSPGRGIDRVEGLAEFDNLRTLCAERNAVLDTLAENEAYPEIVGADEVLLGEALGDTQISLVTTLIERSKTRLFAIVEGAEA